MTLADVCIRRPVFAIMMSVALVVLGVFSYRDLGVDLMPRTEPPTVSIMVRLNGANPEEVESQITKRVEETVNSIDGIDELRTKSGQGNSNTTITFNLEKDIKVAVQDVRDKVAPMLGRLPRDTDPPSVTKADPDSAPILTLAIYGDRDPKELTQIVDRANQTADRIGDGRRFGSILRRPAPLGPAARRSRPPECVRTDDRPGA